MIVVSVVTTLAALVWTFLVCGANSMRSSPGPFVYGPSVMIAWFAVAAAWLAWWVG